MKILQTEAVFLKSYPLAESDKIVACLTPDFGLIKLVAKGSRKLKSRYIGTLEPFTVAEISFYRREDAELGILRQVELRQSYFHLARKINVLAALAYLGDLLTEFSPPDEPNQTLYRMARACLAAVSESVDNNYKIALSVLYFELWVLRLTGFLPEVRFCSECRRHLSSEERIVWSAENRFYCAECSGRNGIFLTSEQNNILRSARKLSPTEFIDFFGAKTLSLDSLSTITRKLIKQVLQHDFEYWREKNWEAVQF